MHWKQNKAQNIWVVTFLSALCACITPSTKRFSSIIWHPDCKTPQQEKVTSNFWIPTWHMKMAPVISLIHIRLKLRRCTMKCLVSSVWSCRVHKKRFLKQCGNKSYSKLTLHIHVQKKERCKIKKMDTCKSSLWPPQTIPCAQGPSKLFYSLSD